jgi:hypothetical protein
MYQVCIGFQSLKAIILGFYNFKRILEKSYALLEMSVDDDLNSTPKMVQVWSRTTLAWIMTVPEVSYMFSNSSLNHSRTQVLINNRNSLRVV